ncbi:sensor histidine kinase [Actinoplanes siamensis]|uniref:histidine kinase n=1 Tax=Actinoplanes siamensis TaxID=1223317 RepID=A0A919TKC6_9ACTN|nr:ATP-binding protein [Actinoplanes siamensis]GIF05452.1 hypothetical protein Asi03nite_29900 [Actinoplanes siamensis]
MSTRTKVIVGLVLLAALWAAAAVPAFAEALRVTSARSTASDIGGPAGTLVLSLESERRLSVAPESASKMAAQRVHTDQARRDLRAARDGWTRRLSGSDATRQADALLARTEQLPAIRSQVESGQLAGVRAADAYTALIDPDGLRTPTVYADQVGDQAAALSALSRSRELLAEEDALLAAMSAQPKLSENDRVRLTTLAGARRELFPTTDKELDAAENAVLTGRNGAAAWSAAYNRVNTDLWALQHSRTEAAAEAGTGHAVLTVVRAGVVGGVGLIAVLGVLLMAWRAGSAGATSRKAATVRAVEVRDTGLDPLLRDLERRNQSLVHRQLRLLDTLARRESDDDTLGEIFRADHLANRLRRNLEKAITLTGGTPGRRWHKPVPLAEVVRAAASEISEYGRVSTARIEPAALAGAAVTDLMHLLAELIENAATFAPAETRVRVAGERVADGYRITVTDVGPGMTEDDLATAARVMTDSTPPAGGTWWGLYAAGRFATRGGIAVSLRNGPDVGLVAEVLVPAALIGTLSADDDTTLHDLEPVIG